MFTFSDANQAPETDISRKLPPLLRAPKGPRHRPPAGQFLFASISCTFPVHSMQTAVLRVSLRSSDGIIPPEESGRSNLKHKKAPSNCCCACRPQIKLRLELPFIRVEYPNHSADLNESRTKETTRQNWTSVHFLCLVGGQQMRKWFYGGTSLMRKRPPPRSTVEPYAHAY